MTYRETTSPWQSESDFGLTFIQTGIHRLRSYFTQISNF